MKQRLLAQSAGKADMAAMKQLQQKMQQETEQRKGLEMELEAARKAADGVRDFMTKDLRAEQEARAAAEAAAQKLRKQLEAAHAAAAAAEETQVRLLEFHNFLLFVSYLGLIQRSRCPGHCGSLEWVLCKLEWTQLFTKFSIPARKVSFINCCMSCLCLE